MQLFFLFIIGSMFFTSTAFAQTTEFSNKPFTDVSTNRADYQAIEYLRKQNVIKGYLDGTFRPNAIINRAEFVEFIINPFILNTNGLKDCVSTKVLDRVKTVYFSDVPKNTWYAENICFAKNKKIIDGYPDGTFRPLDSINFVEAAKIISNVFTLNVDAYQTGEFWFRPYVQNLSDLHAIPTNIRRVNQALSRADMAQIVYRLMVDSTHKENMGFSRSTNSLYQRAFTEKAVTAPAAPVIKNTYSRPSARSIHDLSVERNRIRNAQKK